MFAFCLTSLLVVLPAFASADESAAPPKSSSVESKQLTLPGCEAALTPKKKRQTTAKYKNFEAEARQAFATYVDDIEAGQEKRVITLRDQLADIENANPQGFNTFAHRKREGMSVHVRSLLRLGQDRRVKMLIGQLVINVRHRYQHLQEIGLRREERFQELLASRFEMRSYLDGKIRALDNQILSERAKIGKTIWLYTGIVCTLQEEAGLKPRAGLISDGVERALQDDVARTIERPSNLESLVPWTPTEESAVAPSETPEQVSKIAAMRVLQSLRILASDGTTEIQPSLGDFEALLAQSATVRTAKLLAEIEYERRQQRNQALLGLFSDQYVLGMISMGLNSLTLGKFKDFFDATRKEMEKGVNESVHQGRILEFLGMAGRLSNDAIGNAQLARALITLLGTDSTLLSSIALTEEGIEPLRRVKSVDFVQSTIWAPKSQKLSDAIEELEGNRASDGLNSAVSQHFRRSHFLIKATAASLMTYALFTHIALFDKIGIGGASVVKTTVLGWFGGN